MSLVQKKAPDFDTEAVIGKDFKKVKLGDYKGKWVVLFFYPLDFTFVCPTEITAFGDQLQEFKNYFEVLEESFDFALRGLFIINPEGQIVYEVVHDLPVGRSVEEVLRVLSALQNVQQTGEVCPANWTKGGKTMKPDPEKSKEYFKSV